MPGPKLNTIATTAENRLRQQCTTAAAILVQLATCENETLAEDILFLATDLQTAVAQYTEVTTKKSAA
jgi:hypothetical protein